MKISISVIILTYNEELHIARCIDNVRHISDEIYIVDCFSTDNTCRIAEEHGAKVVQHEYINQAQQFQWALDNLDLNGEWTLRLDADEYLTDELIEEIKTTLPNLDETVGGCYLPRNVIFLERRLKYGQLHPPAILRLWRTGGAYMEQRWMDEQCVLKRGEAVTLKHRFVDHNLNGLTWWTQKHNNYSNRELAVVVGRQYGLTSDSDDLKERNNKKSKYYSLPPFLRCGLYFLARYVVLGGFLDGKPGLIWATLQAYWYRFLIDAKIYEMQQVLGKHPAKEEVRAYFKNRFNITL
jgi:glycosyltransferase involved in cell wall biosynthesis